MTRITVNMAGESATTYYAAPVSKNLAAIHFTVDSLAKSIHNFMRGGSDAAVTGAPIFSATGAVFTDNANFLTTNVSDTNTMTVFIIAKLVDIGTTGAMLFGNHGAAGSGFGMSLFMTSAGAAMGATRYNAAALVNSSAQAVLNGNANTTWGLYVCEVRTDGNYLRNITANTAAQNTLVGDRVLLTSKLRIGANYTSSYDGKTNILAFVAHNTSLTESEIQSWITRLRAYAAGRGITI